MRRVVERGLRRLWTGESRDPVGVVAPILAAGPELVYRFAVALRNRSYARGWSSTTRPRLPVISIGNLHAGGTGKTPLAAWVAALLRDHGHRPALLLRGYGEDEVELHRRWNPDVALFVDSDRVAAAESAFRDGRDVAVLDDGFQHRRLERDLDLVLLPAEGPWSRRLLPRGPLREPLSALRRADGAVVVRRTRAPGEAEATEARIRSIAPHLPVAHAALVADGWRRPWGTPVPAPDGPVLALSGIARPDLFAKTVTELGASEVETVTFPDHHTFSPRELRAVALQAEGRPVVTTEKDAVRIDDPALLGEDVRVLHLRLVLERGREELVRALLSLVPPGEG